MFLLRMRGSRNFCQGGPGLAARKQPGQHFLSLAYFTVSEGVNGFIAEKTILSQGSRGGQHFPKGGGPIFSSGGVQMLISIETHITCDIPGGVVGLDPLPPSGSAHDKLSVYKFTNSVRSTIKLKAVLHEILNVKIKVWKSHVDLDVQFTFVIYREE